MPPRAEPARPVVGATASLHHDQSDGTVGVPALELGTRQALALDGAPVRIGDRKLEDGLGKIDAHDGPCGRIHLGLSSDER